MSKQIIHTDEAPAAVGPYSQAIAVTGTKTVYLSGQIGLEPGTGDLVSENFEAQVRQAFANMQAVIKEAGGTLDNIVKLTLFLTDLNKFTAARGHRRRLRRRGAAPPRPAGGHRAVGAGVGDPRAR